MNIKAKGMLFSIILIMFTTFALGGFSYYKYKSILVSEVNKAVERVAEESADHLNNYIKQYITPLIGLSENEDIISMDWKKQKQIISQQIYPQYQNVAVVDLNGKAYYVDDNVLDLSDRDYVKDTLSGKISFSDIILSRKTGNPVVMIGIPIYNNQKIVGAIIARLDADFLSNFALTRGYGENGRAYIISDKGTFISGFSKNKTNHISNIYNIAKENSRYNSFSEYIKNSIKKESGYGKYQFDKKNIVMGYATVNQTHWRIYIGTYENEALSSLAGLNRIILLILLGTLICSITAAWIFVGRYTKRITELDDLFSKGAKGDFTIRFTPKTKDEIGRVGISFNRMMDKIKTLTQYDPLTAHLNQYVLEKDVEALFHCEDTSDFSLIMVAIDKFSMVNEVYGYSTGDSILIEIANRLSTCVTEVCQIYRYKGDKFVILCRNTADTDFIAQKALTCLSESYAISGKIIDINISIGVFEWTENTRTEDPLKAVTQAKNYAKYLGSNQIQRFDYQINDRIIIMKELQADILNGLKEGQFFLVYQPLFYLENEYIAEAEALIRWNHPGKGLLYPDKFIELAEASGLIVDIDRWVLETACKQLNSWRESHKHPVMLSVNISSKTFETKKFIPDLITLLNRYHVDSTLLQLEITERMVISNVEDSIHKLKELKKMGIRVAIDDFGIGYSSLSYIVRLPIDSIKIDKSFVQNINSSKEAKAIVSTIINLCKTLNLNVIAEGIESQIELEYLRLNQCDIGQGYYFSKPVSIFEIESRHMN